METCICMAESLHCSPGTIVNWLYPNTKWFGVKGKKK